MSGRLWVVAIGAAAALAVMGVRSAREQGGNERTESSYLSKRTSDAGVNTAGERVPVIAELFTSEGCSSCPPANALLQELQDKQPIDGADVIALEEHVDYWNSLGWRDPFSSNAWTERQEGYAAKFRSDSAYTPQLIVNGKTEMVGSREGQVREAIAKAAHEARTDVAVTPNKPEADGSQTYTVCVGRIMGGSGDEPEVMLAVTERQLQSSVTAGENSGETLRHAAVLRTLETIGRADASKELSFTGDPRVKFAPNWKRENLRVVVFVQEKHSGKILGAAETGLTTAVSGGTTSGTD